MKKSLLFLCYAFLLGLTANATDYYIASNGNDGNNGTSQSSPWQSLNKLNAYFSNLRPGDRVFLHRGDTFFGSLAINKSGSAGSPITIGAYGTGEKPVITGFNSINSWNNLGGNIWESSTAVSSLAYTNMVIINGINTAMGRWPNIGALNVDNYSGHSISSKSLQGTNWTGAELAMLRTTFTIGRNKILSQSGNSLNYEWSSNDIDIQHAPGWFSPSFIIQNHPNTLDVQGEWYYNPSSKKLRVYSSGTPNDVKIASIETLIEIGGDIWNGANFITIEDISFIGSNSYSVLVMRSKNVTVQNCDFNYAGISSVYGPWAGNSGNMRIENCTINNSNSTGINLSGDFTNQIIRSNNVNNSGVIPFMMANGGGSGIGISAIGVNTLFEKNRVDNSGYNGIDLYGSNSIVKNNYITNFCRFLYDGGGIYSSLGSEGIKIQDNIIIGLMSGNGIYIDGYSNGVEISGNTIADCRYGFVLNDGQYVKIINNTTYNNGKDGEDGAGILLDNYSSKIEMNNIQIKENIFFARTMRQNSAYYALKGNVPSSIDINNNYYLKPIDDNKSIFTNISGGYDFRNLNNWKNWSGRDQNSSNSPKSITDLSDIHFEFNPSSNSKAINLDANYIDGKGNSYDGSITLAPYSSAVLIKNGKTSNNKEPKAIISGNQTIILPNSSAKLEGRGEDSDGSIASYNWKQLSGPTIVNINNANSADATVNDLVEGSYDFELKVTDNKGAIGLATMKVTVKKDKSSSKPIAYAGLDQEIILPANSAALKGGAYVENGDIVSYQWSQISGPQNATFTRGDQVETGVNGLVEGNYEFSMKIKDNQNSEASSTVKVKVSKNNKSLLPSVNPGSVKSGLDYLAYSGLFNNVPDFTALTSYKSGVSNNFETSVADKSDQFSLKFSGFINIPSDGDYTFYVTSDDGSILSIDGIEVVNNDGVHGDFEKSGSIGLKAGYHAITTGYFQQWGDKILKVSYSGPGVSKQIIPSSALYRTSESDLLPSINPGNTINGLGYWVYEDIFTKVPAFSELTHDKTGVIDNFAINVSDKSSLFAINYEGYINIPADGYYNFYTVSDDGSMLYIDGINVVNNDGLHGAIEKTGTIGLMKGLHKISVGFFQQWGNKMLTVSYSGSGISKQVIPSTSLFRSADNNLLPAVNLTNPSNSIEYAIYEDNFNYVPDFNTIKYKKSGLIDAFKLSVSEKSELFAVKYDGFIKVPSDGQYTFYTTSDDGSLLYIDGIKVVNNDGLHGAIERNGSIGLKAGYHAISVGFFQKYGDKVLNVSFAGPGVAKQIIPSNLLFRDLSKQNFKQPLASLNAFHTEQSLLPEIKAYPNPFINHLNVTLDNESGVYEIQIVDVSGRIVRKMSGKKNEGYYMQSINTASLQKGLYFIKIIQNKKSSTIKIEKN